MATRIREGADLEGAAPTTAVYASFLLVFFLLVLLRLPRSGCKMASVMAGAGTGVFQRRWAWDERLG